MRKFHLKILFHIIGIGSASGICYKDNSAFIISDNSGYLYEYKTLTNTLEKTIIVDYEAAENIPKHLKSDFEAIASFNDTLFIFGSGSTANRNKMSTVNTKTKTVSISDISDLYSAMQGFANIKPNDFNIEGVAYNGKDWYFFQRGNGKTGKNGVFTVSGANLSNEFSIFYNEIKLPKINGIRATFTDAVFVGSDIYFLATAENTQSTYLDGMVLGSLVGKLNLNTMKVSNSIIISSDLKFEGISLFEEKEGQLSFLLCEDNDTALLESNIYQLDLTKD